MKRKAYIHTPAANVPETSLMPAGQSNVFRPWEAEKPAVRRRGSAAGRAILHEPGVSLPGVGRMSRK